MIEDNMKDRVKHQQRASLGHLFTRVGRMLTEHALEKVHQAGYPEVRDSWLPILQHIEDQGIRSIDLANKLNVTKQAANQMVKEIQKQGYLNRQPDPDDKRAQLITLTDQGWKAWLVGLNAMKRMEAQIETSLGIDKIEQMRTQTSDIEKLLCS
jgi:DNA-binding MarR family transcriptional regulator